MRSALVPVVGGKGGGLERGGRADLARVGPRVLVEAGLLEEKPLLLLGAAEEQPGKGRAQTQRLGPVIHVREEGDKKRGFRDLDKRERWQRRILQAGPRRRTPAARRQRDTQIA